MTLRSRDGSSSFSESRSMKRGKTSSPTGPILKSLSGMARHRSTVPALALAPALRLRAHRPAARRAAGSTACLAHRCALAPAASGSSLGELPAACGRRSLLPTVCLRWSGRETPRAARARRERALDAEPLLEKVQRQCHAETRSARRPAALLLLEVSHAGDVDVRPGDAGGDEL